jgi:hypothetical protein
MSIDGERRKLSSAPLEATILALKITKEASDMLPPLKTAVSLVLSIIGLIKVGRFLFHARPLELLIGRVQRLLVLVGMHLEHKSLKRSDY